MPIEWTTSLSLAARSGKIAYDNRHLLQEYAKKIQAYLDRGATQIVVTGRPSAGKSQLIGQLQGQARAIFAPIIEESVKVETFAVKIGEWYRIFRILPGQQGFRTQGEIDVFQGNDSLEGVIHVVDYGFDAPRDAASRTVLVSEDKLDTIQKLRDRNLDLEVDALKHELGNIRRLIVQHARPKWLLIVVNKIDLYHSQVNAALNHYHPEGGSDFSTALRDLARAVGADNLGIYVAAVCAKEVHFEWNGQTLESHLPVTLRDDSLRDLFKTLAQISSIHG